MSPLSIFGIVTGSVFLYFFMAGLTQKLSGWDVDRDGPIGLIWPAALPWFLATWILTKRTKLPKAKVIK